ncbi:MAG: glycosyltransferase family 2 protein [Desulfomonilaceae bacterium]
MKPFVVMRSHNDMPIISQTLQKLHEQTQSFELLCLDNESGDGTVNELRKYASRIVNIPKGTYIPGRVLNLGMELSSGSHVVFLNSDCTPQNSSWLENLLAGFGTDENVAAVFGRQIPRPDCKPLFAKDTEDTYGDGSRQKYWRHCFSMASSAISRAVWEKDRFNEHIQYSEDVDWTWRARQKGYSIKYVPESIVTHSHNYTLKQFYKRHYGEGKAEAIIFDWTPWESSIVRYSLAPYARQMLSDWKYCLRNRCLSGVFASPVLRLYQMLGRRKGFKEGIKEKSQ